MYGQQLSSIIVIIVLYVHNYVQPADLESLLYIFKQYFKQLFLFHKFINCWQSLR